MIGRSVGFLLALCLAAGPLRADDALERIAATGEVRLAVRTDAPPFSARNQEGVIAGYSVELCEAVVADLAIRLNRPLRATHVEVSGANRLEVIASGGADLLCEATSYTLSRRERMEFSLITFVTGIALAVRRDSPLAQGLATEPPRRIGVLAGSTAEAGLRRVLNARPGHSRTIPFESHAEAIGAILSGAVDAYAADREIILAQMFAAGAGDLIAISGQLLSYEPYALAMPPGEARLRLAVDRALAGLYRNGAIRDVLLRWFGERALADPTVEVVFRLLAIPE